MTMTTDSPPPEKKKKEKIAGIVCIWCWLPLTIKDLKTHPCTQPDFLDKQSKLLPEAIERHPSTIIKKKHQQQNPQDPTPTTGLGNDWYSAIMDKERQERLKAKREIEDIFKAHLPPWMRDDIDNDEEEPSP